MNSLYRFRSLFACLSAMFIGLVSSNPVRAQSVFPDKGLEAAVRQQVFAKRYNEEPLTAEDVKNISEVRGRKKEIQNLEGLQHCQALMLIELDDNKIVDLAPIKELKQLQSVSLAGNQIESIEPMAGLVAMQLLDVSRNKLTDIGPVKAMTNMRSLYLNDNQIKSLAPLTELKKISSLYLSNNPIEDFSPIGNVKWLSTLMARGCHIKDVSFLKPLTDLKTLMLADNEVSDLSSLVEMCAADAAADRRFSPFLDLHIYGNPLSDVAKGEQVGKLKEFGVRVKLEPPQPKK